jgi:hypothetical protein
MLVFIMNSFSNGALLAWKIAAREALEMGADNITKEHLFIGLLSLDKVISDSPSLRRNNSNESPAAEWDAIRCLLQITGHDPVVLRRLMRMALPRKNPRPAGTMMHRSPGCREVFDTAARSAGTWPVTSNDLFTAIMERPGESITCVLTEARSCSAGLRITDTPILPGDFSAAGKISAPVAELRSVLSRDAVRFSENITHWQAQSFEYAVTLTAIRERLSSLALIALETRDVHGLIEALEMLRPWAGEAAGSIDTLIAECQALQENEGVPDARFEAQTRFLLDKLRGPEK